ncbi:uncharacterized protein PV06_11271 [Exophiala oligosperma]|uniref:Prolyl 4-hydroxylase alpha subunit Fe(2+) 2OG dioxygenase domain-containing protein n=1 Tax=Exophiala oligosperma TaxID=215243 RepID=A0A0D2A894_9EURO|nr:uncharacterized protein PV06_11271 [Exophiala oligosperma]KIW36506.1 hypothetical protein PV06_11271 [Exophiala oligosperma]
MSCEEGFSDEEDHLEPLRSQILGCLDGIHTAGSFVTSAHDVEHVHPGLVVSGIGPIRLPLCQDDANALIGLSRRAPFGKGSKTLVDETVRKTWEIDGKELSFKHEAWYNWLDGVVGNVSKGLGVHGGAGNVRAELYKLLVYEEGAFFKPHKDTEKTKDMFGTLVICLPSEHVGGGVRLIHGLDERVLETDKCSSYGVSYLAWYSDVSHEVLSVQSGYRLVLTYNLINTTSDRHPSAAALDVEQSNIEATLGGWCSMPDKPRFMCYVLQHKYTSAKLRLSGLKGDDYYRCCWLDRACRSNGRFCLVLARLELTVTRINDEECLDQGDEELCLNDIVTLEGFQLQDSLSIRKDSLAQRGLYESREHDEQWGGEHLGNQHADIEQVNRDAVAVIVSRDEMTEFLLGNGRTFAHYAEFLQRLLAELKRQNGDEGHLLREMIVQTCQKHTERRYHNSGDKDRFMGATAVASLQIENPPAAKAALHAVRDSFDASTFQNLGRLGFEKTREFCTDAFSRISKLHLVARGLRAFRSGVSSAVRLDASEASEQAVYQWAVDVLFKALSSVVVVLPKDAGAIVQIVDAYEDERLLESMNTFVGRFFDDATFINALFAEILCYSKTVQEPNLLVQRLIPPIFDKAMSSFRLQQFSSLSKLRSPQEDYPFSSWPDIISHSEKSEKDASVVASLYRQLVRDDLDKAGQLLEKIANDTASIHQDDLDRFIIPLLCEMIDIPERQPSEAAPFYSKIISTYIERTVQKEPPKPQDWSLPDDARECYWADCTYCPVVREFLGNPSREDWDFTISEDRYYDFTRHLPFHYTTTRGKRGEHYDIKVTKSLKT